MECGKSAADLNFRNCKDLCLGSTSHRQERALTCGKTAALVVCIADTKTTCRHVQWRREMPQEIFPQLELNLNFVWYNIAQTTQRR